MQRIEYNELCRIEKLEKKVPLPSLYQENMRKAEEREQRARDIKEMKLRKILKAEEVSETPIMYPNNSHSRFLERIDITL